MEGLGLDGTFEPLNAVPYCSWPLRTPAYCAVSSRVAYDRRKANLPSKQFHHLPYGHPRWETVRVHDYICNPLTSDRELPRVQIRHTWTDALIIERHILLAHNQTAYAFLPVPGGELVAEFRSPRLSD
jgi:hypothetical protein